MPPSSVGHSSVINQTIRKCDTEKSEKIRVKLKLWIHPVLEIQEKLFMSLNLALASRCLLAQDFQIISNKKNSNSI